MKKQKMIKHVASISDPSLENSFSAPATHSGEISVVFRGKNISIHGWDGSSWTTIHNSNGIDPQFKFENTYESYYLKSLTGQEETIPVSFFSTNKYQGSTPLLAGVNREVKLYDVEEIPIYTTADENKMLTVMSNGSLAWLLANESFIVPSEEGENNNSQDQANTAGLEEHSDGVLVGGAQLTNGVLNLSSASDLLSIPNSAADFGDYHADGGAMSYEAWFNTDELGHRRAIITSARSGYQSWEGFGLSITNESSATGGVRIYSQRDGGRNQPIFNTPISLNEWHHVVWTVTESGFSLVYLDGQQIGQHQGQGVGNSDFLNIGGGTGVDSLTGFIDGVFIHKGVVLTPEQVTSKYETGRGEGGSYESGGENTLGIEELETTTLHGNAELIDGVLNLTSDGDCAKSNSSHHDGATEQTISVWINASQLGNVSSINNDSNWVTGGSTVLLTRDHGAIGRPNGFALHIASNAIRYTGPHQSGSVRQLYHAVSSNTWHKFDLVWGSNFMKLYMNGELIDSGSTSGSVEYGRIPLEIGRNNTSNVMQFYGQIDGVTVENVAKTDSEILASYQTGRGESEPEPSANMVGLEEDASATLHGNAQLIDGVLHVDGTDGTYLSLPHSADFDKGNGDLSINLWFNANSLPNEWNSGLVSKMGGGWSGWLTAISTLDAEDGTGLMPEGGIQTTMFGGGGGDKNDRSRVPGGVTLNTWHHVAFVMPAVGDFKMYFNGQEVHSYVPFFRDSVSSGDLRIGGWGPVNGFRGFFDGMIDGVFVEKKVLTAQEVSDIHAAGRGESEPAQTYLEETATLYGDANISGGALVLDGNGDYAVIDDGFRFTDTLSTSIWFKTTATGDRRIYSSHVRGMSGDDFKNGFFARLNNGQLKYRHPSGGTAELTGPSGLNDGQWHHMAVTWENNVGYTLYVDGSQVATGGAGASDGYASGWGLYIGANPWLNNNPYGFFSGEVSKFEVLNEVLTAQDVADRYNAGV
jgi:hypothetical protein